MLSFKTREETDAQRAKLTTQGHGSIRGRASTEPGLPPNKRLQNKPVPSSHPGNLKLHIPKCYMIIKK